jgi:ferredoxin
MNRILAEGDFEKAIELSKSELVTDEIACTTCPGYCENACRRKKVDIPVSIRNMQLFISQRIKKDMPALIVTDKSIRSDHEVDKNSGKLSKRFSSRIGKLEANELQEWVKECGGDGIRFREIPDTTSAAGEAESCMHCDCRAADDCRLRDFAQEFEIKDPRPKIINAPIKKKINQKSGLIFENAKCIKCGLCVRLCEDSKEEPALCFINRGFISIISEPIGEDFNNILKTKSKEVIEICPTGALSKFK